MSYTLNRTPESYKQSDGHYSEPHLEVIRELQQIGLGTGLETEQPVIGKCGNPKCRHTWCADIYYHKYNFIAEVHGDFDDEEDQDERKTCLEGAGFVVVIYPTSMKAKDVAWKIWGELWKLRQLAEAAPK